MQESVSGAHQRRGGVQARVQRRAARRALAHVLAPHVEADHELEERRADLLGARVHGFHDWHERSGAQVRQQLHFVADLDDGHAVRLRVAIHRAQGAPAGALIAPSILDKICSCVWGEGTLSKTEYKSAYKQDTDRATRLPCRWASRCN
jgi:hypothetical protein